MRSVIKLSRGRCRGVRKPSVVRLLERAGALLLLTTAPMAAQSDAQSAYAPQCPVGTTPVIDSGIVTVQISAASEWRDRKYSAAQRSRIVLYADALRERFVPPSTLGELPTLGVQAADGTTDTSKGSTVVPHVAITGRLVLILDDAGRLKRQAWEEVPLSAAFANAVTDAAAAADSTGGFDGMPPVAPGDGDTLALDITSRTKLNAAQPVLMRARIVSYVVTQSPAVMRQEPPEYPEQARRARTENDGIVTFIIGSNGRAVSSSVQVTRTNYRDFILPMRRSVANGTYRAGLSGSCRVPIAVRQEFAFRGIH